jgi:hypothetical protein
MSKRILLYCLLGPTLCYAMVLALNPSQVLVSLRSLGDTLPAAYIVLTGPFFLGALADQIAKNRWRLLFVALVVFAAMPIAILNLPRPATSDTLASALKFSFLTIIPAAICSWLSNASKRPVG